MKAVMLSGSLIAVASFGYASSVLAQDATTPGMQDAHLANPEAL